VKKIVCMIMLTISMLSLAFNIQPVKMSVGQRMSILTEDPTVVWSKTYGGAGNDSGNCIVQTSDGGYIIGGTYNYSTYRGWVVKTDIYGSMSWNKTFGLLSAYVQQTSDGGFIIGTWGAPGIVSLVKTDFYGNITWSKTYHDILVTWHVEDIQQASDGGYVVLSNCFSLTWGEGIIFFKTDSDGNLEWQKDYAPFGTRCRGYDFVETSDGGYMIAGLTSGFGAVGYDFWLVRTDANGNMLWNKTYGGAGTDIAYSLAKTSDGGFVMVGSTTSFGAGGSDLWLVKVDANGNLVWSKTYGGAGNDSGNCIVQTSDGGFVMVGSTTSFGAGGSDLWLVKVDANGNKQGDFFITGGVKDDWGSCVIESKDKLYFIVAGATESFGAGGRDLWLIKIGPSDIDGDGLPDAWEKEGIDINNDGTIDLNLPVLGANWRHKDLFIEVDYMGKNSSTQPYHDHRPDDAALDNVKRAFRDAPVDNPDGTTGITLHIEIDDEIPHQYVIRVPDDFDGIKTSYFGTAAQRGDPNSANILAAKRLVYRYCLFIHQYAYWSGSAWVTTTSSGIAELPGNDFIVSLGAFDFDRGTRDQQEGTFMHELGHTLGLRHGGCDDINGKPNYISVMSYSRQFSDFIPNRPLDYSRRKLPTLNESNLNEADGINDPDMHQTVYAIRNHEPARDSSQGPIDWNMDGDKTDRGISLSINYFVDYGFGDNDLNLLKGYNDWANLQFSFRDTESFDGGFHFGFAFHVEITWEAYEEMRNTTVTGPAYQTLDIMVTDGGRTNPHQGIYNYERGASVSVTAIPYPGYVFNHWELDGANLGSANPITVMMNSDHNLLAVFELRPYNVTIKAHCNIEGVVTVDILMDGSPTGYTTPHTFTNLTLTHTFTVPDTDPNGHPFKQWSTGETSTTITVTEGGTYTAYYEAPPPPPGVGGYVIPVDKFALLAPYIGLASATITTVATIIYIKRVKNKKQKQ